MGWLEGEGEGADGRGLPAQCGSYEEETPVKRRRLSSQTMQQHSLASFSDCLQRDSLSSEVKGIIGGGSHRNFNTRGGLNRRPGHNAA